MMFEVRMHGRGGRGVVTSAQLLGLRTLLGLDADPGGALRCAPHLPGRLGRLRLTGIAHRGGRQDTT